MAWAGFTSHPCRRAAHRPRSRRRSESQNHTNWRREAHITPTQHQWSVLFSASLRDMRVHRMTH